MPDSLLLSACQPPWQHHPAHNQHARLGLARALYTCFAVFGVFSGVAPNLLGMRATLLLGALTYPLYVGYFLYYNQHLDSQVFPVMVGTPLSFGVGSL